MKPVNEEERKIAIGITVEPALLKKIDELRGKEPRSPFIRRLLWISLTEEKDNEEQNE